MAARALVNRLRWVFVGQALAALGLMMVATLVGGNYLRDRLLKQRAGEETAVLWQRLSHDPRTPMPRTTGMTAYFVPQAVVAAGLPPVLARLAPGQHVLPSRQWRVVEVSERPQGRLYVFINPALSSRLVSNTAWLALLVSLLGIGLLAWAGYRRTRDFVRPVQELAEQIRVWNPLHDRDPQWRQPATGIQRSLEVETLRAALDGMARRMQEYVERERTFTRDASHELRTPLTVVRMAGDLLAREEHLSPRGRRSVSRIEHAARDMEELTDAFLVLARHPDVPMDVQDVRLLDVVYEEVAAMRELAIERPVALRVVEHADPHLQAPVRMVAVMLAQLLRNAVRFTEQGTIEVIVDADRFSVRDTGIGMDAQTLARVFEPFYRADIGDNTAKGLGLSVVLRLADRFGWKVELDSTPGAGTTATVRFA